MLIPFLKNYDPKKFLTKKLENVHNKKESDYDSFLFYTLKLK